MRHKPSKLNTMKKFNYKEAIAEANRTFEPFHIIKSKNLENYYFLDNSKDMIKNFPNDYLLIFERCENGVLRNFEHKYL